MSHKSNFCGSRSESRTACASGTIHQTILDGRRRVSFAPGSIFAFVRWASSEYGTVVSRIHILRAVAPGERYSTVPFVQPGGEILLNLARWPKVEKVFHAIEVVEALGIDPDGTRALAPCSQPA